MSKKKWDFWIDRGGTFTDVVGHSPNGTLKTLKLLSENPEQYKDAAVQGIRLLLELTETDPLPEDMIDSVKMGTTVATNALLERKGDRTVLLINEGLKDLLRVGYQNRPKLFDLEIKKQSAIYEDVVEIPGRLDSKGLEITRLDEQLARSVLLSSFKRGFRSVAIAFIHSYLNSSHENRVAEIAREVGYTQISTSSGTSRLIKLVSRGDTTVVDAYLSPILRRYINQVSEELKADKGGVKSLFFMQSSGGLVDSGSFQGRDAILSGPAGGVVGMVKTGEVAGFKKLIGFDMGGTSTDVCHFSGHYERSFETEIAGVRMRAPMMNIHTVAAGGGSILSFQDGRYQVGPDSAGANPGPACYRRGGPLTVTDCNVVLGKINPKYFPKIFGPTADEPLDKEIVIKKFKELADSISAETGIGPLSPEETAVGFLRIAVQNMARAIKKISVDRGYNITEYTLNCFGGAGGQHACAVADALSMSTVFLHPYSGVLSAFGMGLADIRVLKEQHFNQDLRETLKAGLIIKKLSNEAIEEVVNQGVPRKEINVIKTAYLKYSGSHQNIEVNFDSSKKMLMEFKKNHQIRFGFASPVDDLIIDMLTVEAIGKNNSYVDQVSLGNKNESKAISQISLSGYGEIPLYNRELLVSGQILKGPSVVMEKTGTTVVEDGWEGFVDKFGNLILQRLKERESELALGTKVNPIMLEVFNNLFMSIAEQMGSTLQNTAYSVNIKERLDFSCALFDASGNLVANAPHVPVHLGSMSDAVRKVAELNYGKIKPGDSFVLNAPFNGGTHLPDVTVITPVFNEQVDKILFFVGSRGHHADIGGRTPGSAPPDSKSIEEEGVVIDNFKIVDQGNFRAEETRELLRSGLYPCRNIDQNIKDLEAQLAANETGIREVTQMIKNFGIKTVQAYMNHVQDNAEASVRQVVGKLKNGSFTYPMDFGQKIEVQVRVNAREGTAEVDFTGTSLQGPNNYNAPRSICNAVVLYVFRTLVGAEIPLNEGCLKPLKIIAPEGSMINPKYPAAVIAGNTEVSQNICDCLFGALGVIAGSQATMNNFVWGNDHFQNYETIAGGSGAGPGFHGASGTQVHMTNTLMTDPEVLESRFPVRLENFSIRKGSGGKGAWTGGDGIRRVVKFLNPVTVTTLCSHRIVPPFGVGGGSPGMVGLDTVIRANGAREQQPGNTEVHLESGDAFEMLTPGGGGWGEYK